MKKSLNLIGFVFLLSSIQISAQSPNVLFSSVISSSLSSPMQLTHAGDGSNRIFVAEKGGRIKVFTKNYVLSDTLIRIFDMGSDGEQGLLSVVFHPNFKNNGYFFVCNYSGH